MRNFAQIQEMLRTAQPAILDLTDAEVDSLSASDIEALEEEFRSNVLMKLPPREQAFMDWLKREDPGIYEDLWEDDEDLLVSLSFLPAMQKGGSGFSICELAFHDNYYFTQRHVKPTGIAAMPGILARAQKGEELSIGEVLMFEIVRAPIDLWHFCYRYGVPLKRGRAVVRELDANQWLVHLPRGEDLSSYIE
ncbi:MAG: hypothetical protein WC824_08695 [Bacteroidota bacterium]|jgi:hypothetical protein